MCFIDPQSDGATETVCKLKSCQYYSYSYSTDDNEVLKRIKDWVENGKISVEISIYIYLCKSHEN